MIDDLSRMAKDSFDSLGVARGASTDFRRSNSFPIPVTAEWLGGSSKSDDEVELPAGTAQYQVLSWDGSKWIADWVRANSGAP